MKYMLLKEIEGLEVGKTYDLGKPIFPGSRFDNTSYFEFKDDRNFSKRVYLNESFFENWFIFQEIPEQLKEGVEKLLCYWEQTDDYTSVYQNTELLENVIDVLEGKE
jgi:hypothetical protein